MRAASLLRRRSPCTSLCVAGETLPTHGGDQPLRDGHAPRVKLGNAVGAIHRQEADLQASGSLTPQQTAGSQTVKIKCYLKKSGKWKLKKTVTATNSNPGVGVAVHGQALAAEQGSWKLVATSAATAKYAATTSGPVPEGEVGEGREACRQLPAEAAAGRSGWRRSS